MYTYIMICPTNACTWWKWEKLFRSTENCVPHWKICWLYEIISEENGEAISIACAVNDSSSVALKIFSACVTCRSALARLSFCHSFSHKRSIYIRVYFPIFHMRTLCCIGWLVGWLAGWLAVLCVPCLICKRCARKMRYFFSLVWLAWIMKTM